LGDQNLLTNDRRANNRRSTGTNRLQEKGLLDGNPVQARLSPGEGLSKRDAGAKKSC